MAAAEVTDDKKKKKQGNQSANKFKPSSGKKQGRRLRHTQKELSKKIARWEEKAKKEFPGSRSQRRWDITGLFNHRTEIEGHLKRVG